MPKNSNKKILKEFMKKGELYVTRNDHKNAGSFHSNKKCLFATALKRRLNALEKKNVDILDQVFRVSVAYTHFWICYRTYGTFRLKFAKPLNLAEYSRIIKKLETQTRVLIKFEKCE